MLIQSSDCVRKVSDLARFKDDFFEQISTLFLEERTRTREQANKNEPNPNPDIDFTSGLKKVLVKRRAVNQSVRLLTIELSELMIQVIAVSISFLYL